MLLFHSDRFTLPLPDGHRFPMDKYRRLRQALQASPLPTGVELVTAQPATDRELLRVHAADWVDRVVAGALTPAEVRRLGFPWSPALVERSRRSVGATLGACRSALERGGGVNLAGGTHHAFAGRGEGFCVFNDVAVALRAMQSEGRMRRGVVIDLDVHQGNGTAKIFSGDDTVFTCSVHGRRNYPLRKQRSDLDVELDDGAGDAQYLAAVDGALARLPLDRAQLAVYLAGADAYEGDRLGRLAVSRGAMAERDRRVLRACRAAGLPVAVVMGGGYAPRVEEIVEIHLATVRIAIAVLADGGWEAGQRGSRAS